MKTTKELNRNIIFLPFFYWGDLIFFSVPRIEKDKGQIGHEIGDVRAATDEVNRSKVSNTNKTISYINGKLDRLKVKCHRISASTQLTPLLL